MWRSKRFMLVAMLIAVVLVGSVVGVGCSPTGNGDGLPPRTGDEGLPKAIMARAAEILEIEQQKLEDAFAQAQSEMQDSTQEDRQPEAQMPRVAAILGLEQQDLQDAFAHAQSEMGDKAPRQRPSNHNPGPWGANKK